MFDLALQHCFAVKLHKSGGGRKVQNYNINCANICLKKTTNVSFLCNFTNVKKKNKQTQKTTLNV